MELSFRSVNVSVRLHTLSQRTQNLVLRRCVDGPVERLMKSTRYCMVGLMSTCITSSSVASVLSTTSFKIVMTCSRIIAYVSTSADSEVSVSNRSVLDIWVSQRQEDVNKKQNVLLNIPDHLSIQPRAQLRSQCITDIIPNLHVSRNQRCNQVSDERFHKWDRVLHNAKFVRQELIRDDPGE